MTRRTQLVLFIVGSGLFLYLVSRIGLGALVRDAIETLYQEDGQKAIAELEGLGARLTTTDQALSALNH